MGHCRYSQTNATKNNHFNNNGLVITNITCAPNGHHQIALTNDGQVRGTGRNSNYELGFSDTSNRTKFTKIPFFEKNQLRVKQVACANQYSTFLTNNGAVYVCGKSLDGALGLGIKVSKSQTVRKIDAMNGKAMTHISCGNNHTLSIDEDGWLWSWGKNNFGQLGNGRKWTRKEMRFKKKGKRRMMHGFGPDSDDSDGDDDETLPQKIGYFVDNKIKTIAIACGYEHNLSLDSKNRVYSWGYNSHSECGHGSFSHVLTPKAIDALKNIVIVDIKAGTYHNVAMSKDFQFYVWGTNGSYQCLSGNTSNVPVPTKFDSNNNPQLSGDTVLSIWPGKDATHVIALPKVRENQKLRKLLRNEIDSNDGLKRRIQDIQGTLRRERNGNRLTAGKLNSLKTKSDAQKKEYESLQKEHQNQTDELKKVTGEKVKIQRELLDRDRNIERMKREITSHQNKSKRREKEIQSKTQQINRQQNERQTMQQTLRAREQENTSLRSNSEAQKKEIESMSKEMKKLNETIEEQKNKEHSLKRQTERLQNEAKNRNNDIQRMSKQIEGHQKSLKEREQQIQSKRREIDGLKKAAAVQQKEFRSLEEKSQTQEKQNKSMVQQMNQLKEKVETQEKENQSVTKKLKGLQNDIQLREGNMDKVKRQNQSKTQQILRLQGRLQAQEKQNKSMSNEMVKLNETIEVQKKERQSMTKQSERLQKEITDQNSNIQIKANEIQRHQKSLKVQEKQIQSKSREIEGLRKEATAQQQRFQLLENKNVSMVQQMNQLKEKVQSQEKEKQSMTKQLKGLQRDVQFRNRNIEKMKKQIESQQKAHNVQEKENQSQTQQIVRLQQRLKLQDQAKQKLQQTLQNREKENRSMVQQLERLQQETEGKAAEIRRAGKEIYDTRKTLDEEQKEKRSILNQLQQVRNEGVVKDKQIADLKETLDRSYTLDVVDDRRMQSEETKDEDEAKANPQGHGDHALYDKHRSIVSEWNVLTEKLQKLADPLKGGNDDEKQPAEPKQGALSAGKLLREYEASSRLMNQQNERLKLVDDSHLSDLVSHQKSLNVEYCLRCTQHIASSLYTLSDFQ